MLLSGGTSTRTDRSTRFYTHHPMEPETKYARLGEDRIANQVVGDGQLFALAGS